MDGCVRHHPPCLRSSVLDHGQAARSRRSNSGRPVQGRYSGTASPPNNAEAKPMSRSSALARHGRDVAALPWTIRNRSRVAAVTLVFSDWRTSSRQMTSPPSSSTVFAGADHFGFGGTHRMVSFGACHQTHRNAARDGIEIVGAQRQPGFQGNRVVDIDQRPRCGECRRASRHSGSLFGGPQQFAGRHAKGFVMLPEPGIDRIGERFGRAQPARARDATMLSTSSRSPRRRPRLIDAQQQGVCAGSPRSRRPSAKWKSIAGPPPYPCPQNYPELWGLCLAAAVLDRLRLKPCTYPFWPVPRPQSYAPRHYGRFLRSRIPGQIQHQSGSGRRVRRGCGAAGRSVPDLRRGSRPGRSFVCTGRGCRDSGVARHWLQRAFGRLTLDGCAADCEIRLSELVLQPPCPGLAPASISGRCR